MRLPDSQVLKTHPMKVPDGMSDCQGYVGPVLAGQRCRGPASLPHSPHPTRPAKGCAPREALTNFMLSRWSRVPSLLGPAKDAPAAGSPCPSPSLPPEQEPRASFQTSARHLPGRPPPLLRHPQTPLGLVLASTGGRQPDQALSLGSSRQGSNQV